MSSVKEIQSVHHATLVMETIAARQPIGVSELARTTGIDKSAVHRLAVTLHRAGWLERAHEGQWRVSNSFARLARNAGDDALVAVARPAIQRLRDETAETSMLVVIDHGCLIVRDVAESRHALRIAAPVGAELPLRNSSALRSIAAHLPAEDLARMRDFDPSLDDDLLGDVRSRGWALNDREIVDEARVIGAAVLDRGGHPLGAIIVCAPASRTDPATIATIGTKVADAANRLRNG